jgi:hypothetical protein
MLALSGYFQIKEEGSMGKFMVGRTGFLPICALLLVLPFMMLPDIAFAQNTVAINPMQGPPGMGVTGTGTNWQSGHHIQISWEYTTGVVLANTTVKSDGTFHIPPDLVVDQ